MDGIHMGEQQIKRERKEIQTQTVDKDKYQHPRMEMKDNGLWYEKNTFQEKSGIGYVRQTIEKEMGILNNPYLNIDKIRTSDNPQDRQKKLHYARGTQLFNDGHNVLELDLAGTGFKEFRAEQKGFHGKNKEDKAKIEAQYGKSRSEALKYVKIRDKEQENGVTKRRVTIAGSLGFLGANAGDYKIENARQYAFNEAVTYLFGIFEQWRDKWGQDTVPDEKAVHVLLRGHSRGGVGAIESAMMIKKWVDEVYPQYSSLVKFEITQLDPVAGIGSNWGTHEKVDHDAMYTSKMMKALGDSAETTVMYSIHADYKYGFTPQLIRGAKRVILTPFKHSMGQENVDKTQGKKHRTGYTDAGTGEVYRGAAINELPEGVYYLDEQNTLVKMESYEQASHILDELLKDTSGQEARHEVIRASVKDWFEKRSMNIPGALDDLTQDERKTWGISFKDSTLMKSIKDSAGDFKKNLGVWAPTHPAFFKQYMEHFKENYDDLMRNCEEYIKTRNPDSDAGIRRLERVKAVRNQLLVYRNVFDMKYEELERKLLEKDQDFFQKERSENCTLGDILNIVGELNINVKESRPQPEEKELEKNKQYGNLLVTYDQSQQYGMEETNDKSAKWLYTLRHHSGSRRYENLHFEKARGTLFKQEPSIKDVTGAGLGDEKFLTELGVLAMKDPQKIMDCMIDRGDTVTVRFYKNRFNILKDMPRELRNILLQKDPQLLISDSRERMEKGEQGVIPAEQRLMIHLLTTRLPAQSKSDTYPVGMERLRKMMPMEDNLCHIDEICALTEKMAKDTRLKPVVDAMMNKAATKEKKFTRVRSDDEKMKSVIRAAMQALNDMQEDDFQDIMNLYGRELAKYAHFKPVPVYVTVNKSIATNQKGDVEPQGNELWVRIMEKAYAASGLAINQNMNLRDETMLKGKDKLVYNQILFFVVLSAHRELVGKVNEHDYKKVLKQQGIDLEPYQKEAQKYMDQGYSALTNCDARFVARHITG